MICFYIHRSPYASSEKYEDRLQIYPIATAQTLMDYSDKTKRLQRFTSRELPNQTKNNLYKLFLSDTNYILLQHVYRS